MALDAIRIRSGWNMSRPLDETGHAQTAFPGRAFLATERSITSVRPEHELVAVVRAVNDDGVVIDAEVFEFLDKGANKFVVFQHAGADDIFLGASFIHGHLDIFGIG